MQYPRLILKPGRDKALRRRHPWIFSGAVARLHGDCAPGATLRVESADGAFLGWGAGNPEARIAARVFSFEESVPLDAALLERRVASAIRLRESLLPGVAAVRLLNAESDELPGVICDRYGEVLVLQLTSAGAVRWREALVTALRKTTGLTQVHERTDAEALALEGLTGLPASPHAPTPSTRLHFVEHGLDYEVDLIAGQKTGFYLDQRDNRALARRLGAVDTALDCFCYTGGFTLNLLAGGARHVTAIDSSAAALAVGARHVVANGFAAGRVNWVEDDVFRRLRRLRDAAESFDLVVLDPPKFAPTAALAERAARGYKDINLLAFKLLKPGGLLLTFSCSGGVSRDLFQKIVAGAAADAGVPAQILGHLTSAPDHPVGLHFPEGDYLKGLLLRIPG